MSFKREGNDNGLLNNLRRRRIKELFAEEVPDDEAKLLSNGRFACLVCNSNPVFDTVNRLMVHRKGKKHIANEAIFIRKKKELKVLILKRKHEQFLKNGTTNIRQAPMSHTSGINSSQSYDPRVKKAKLKPHDRKPRLDLLSDSEPQASSSNNCTAFTGSVPTKHTPQLKNIFPCKKSLLVVQPYSSHRRPIASCSSLTSSNVSQQDTLSTLPSEHSDNFAMNQSLTINQSPHSQAFSHFSSESGTPPKTLRTSVVSFTASNTKMSGACGQGSGQETSIDSGKKDAVLCVGVEQSTADCGSRTSVDSTCNVSSGDSERKKIAEKYYKLSGSGWKKDWDGKWIRDEEAEFDSDEEPPDLP